MDATTLYPHFQMPIAQMEPPPKPSAASLFQVYLRLKPTISQAAKSTRFLTVNQSVSSADDSIPAHITVVPPTESRRRAVEKFAFTRIFEEDATQLDILRSSGIVPLIEGVIGTESHAGRDGLIAALGMSGSGKSHTILGDSRTQRGITQMGLDLIFRSLGKNVVHPKNDPSMTYTLTVSDTAEAHIQTADSYLDGIYGEAQHGAGGGFSRAATPMSPVGRHSEAPPQFPGAFPRDSCSSFVDRAAALLPRDGEELEEEAASVAAVATASSQLQRSPSKLGRAYAKLKSLAVKDGHSLDILPPPSRKKLAHRPDAFPTQPDVASLAISAVQSSDYAVLISMYEVHNDRIFDLLSPSSSTTPNQHHHHQTSILRANQNQNQNQKDLRRRALLFKATEQSGDRKVVAGLTKVVCGDLKEALTVLETGLLERKVTGTGSNAVSSRSHGFFCIELMRRTKGGRKHWLGSTLTIVDLAGLLPPSPPQKPQPGPPLRKFRPEMLTRFSYFRRLRARPQRENGRRDPGRRRQDQRVPHVPRPVPADAERQHARDEPAGPGPVPAVQAD